MRYPADDYCAATRVKQCPRNVNKGASLTCKPSRRSSTFPITTGLRCKYGASSFVGDAQRRSFRTSFLFSSTELLNRQHWLHLIRLFCLSTAAFCWRQVEPSSQVLVKPAIAYRTAPSRQTKTRRARFGSIQPNNSLDFFSHSASTSTKKLGHVPSNRFHHNRRCSSRLRCRQKSADD